VTTSARSPIVCPACGGENPHDAVFCGNEVCKKALGEFRYVPRGALVRSIEAISQNRQSAHADKRAELDYEVNVRTYREIREIDAMLRAVMERLEKLEATVRSRA
jgi:hypothetical protein